MPYRSYLQPRLEAAEHIDALVQARHERLSAADSDGAARVDRMLEPYRELYRNAGAKYGGGDSGMVKWYYARAHRYAFGASAGQDGTSALKRRAG